MPHTTVFGPDQEDPIDIDQELVEEIQEQADKAVPLNRFPSGPERGDDDISDMESSDEYEEAMVYGASSGFDLEEKNQMVNLSFSLPCDLNRLGRSPENISNEKTRVRSAPHTNIVNIVSKVTTRKIEKRGKSAPVKKIINIANNLENSDIKVDETDTDTIYAKINPNSCCDTERGMTIESLDKKEFKQSEHTKEYESINKSVAKTKDVPTICQIYTIPGEVFEDQSANQKADMNTYLQSEEKISCFHKYLWINPLKLCCVCMGSFYD